jgi:hypothetical protein
MSKFFFLKKTFTFFLVIGKFTTLSSSLQKKEGSTNQHKVQDNKASKAAKCMATRQ